MQRILSVLHCLFFTLVICDLTILSPNEHMYHENALSSSSKVSPDAALQLAMESIQLASPSLPDDQEISIQADVFHHAKSYVLIMIEGVSLNLLNDINAPFRKTFSLDDTGSFGHLSSVLSSVCRSTYRNASVIVCGGSCEWVSEADKITPVVTSSSEISGFDVVNPVDHAFLSEYASLMQMLTSITSYTQRTSANDAPDLYVLAFSSLQHLSGQKLELASTLLASQLDRLVAELSKSYGTSIAVQSISGYSPSAENIMGVARRLQNNVTITSPTLTLAEITDYQITLWTSVILIVLVLASSCALCNMSIGRDSLLYATFITDAAVKTN